jgi:hypothetical protein
MAAVVGITLIKRFTYRGDALEEWSNQYHLSGSVPANGTDWQTLIDALVAQEKTIYANSTVVVRAYGYDSDAEDATAVYSKDWLAGGGSGVVGTLNVSGAIKYPGDAAVWVRWKTSRTNSRGKPIYLRKYFHDARGNSSGSVDDVFSGQKTALGNFGVKLRDGSFLDARTIRSRTHAETIVGSAASDFVTTRTLHRRGRRPPS